MYKQFLNKKVNARLFFWLHKKFNNKKEKPKLKVKNREMANV